MLEGLTDVFDYHTKGYLAYQNRCDAWDYALFGAFDHGVISAL